MGVVKREEVKREEEEEEEDDLAPGFPCRRRPVAGTHLLSPPPSSQPPSPDAATASGSAGSAAYCSWRDARLSSLASLLEDGDKAMIEIARLAAVQDWHRQGGPAGGGSVGGGGDHHHLHRQGRQRAACLWDRLEASLVNEAELVFTTLASAGRGVFARLSHGFEVRGEW